MRRGEGKRRMEVPNAPEVNFESYDHYLDMESALYRVMRGLIHARVQSNLRFWMRWPHIVNVNIAGIGAMALMRVTQGNGVEWGTTVLCRAEAVLTAVATAVITLGRLRGKNVDATELTVVLDDTIAREVESIMRPLMIKNIVRIVSPLRDPLVNGGYGMPRFYAWGELFDLRLALASGGHKRIGEGSPLLCLDDTLLRTIVLAAYARDPPFFDV